jgi:hypothetical protein
MLDVVEEVEKVQKDHEGRGQILRNAEKHFNDEDQVEKMKRANERTIQGMTSIKQSKDKGKKRLKLGKDELEVGARAHTN